MSGAGILLIGGVAVVLAAAEAGRSFLAQLAWNPAPSTEYDGSGMVDLSAPDLSAFIDSIFPTWLPLSLPHAATTTGGVAIPLEESIRALMPDLLAYFLRRIDNREDAADALSETLLVLWRRERAVPADEEGRRRYAFGVAARVLATAQRGRLWRSALAGRLREELSTRVGAPPTVDVEVTAALVALPERDRELVLLVAWEGFSVAEAGAVIGVPTRALR